MIDVALAVTPVFAVIALGWAARATGIVPREQWAGIDRLAYWAFFPALIFTTIARADFHALAAGRFMAAAIAAFASVAAITIGLKPFLKGVSGPAFTSLLQGAIRWNGMVIVAAAEPVFGPTGMALAALVFGPVTPLVNIISVGALSIWGDGAAPTWASFVRRLATNPMILACLAGWLGNASGLFHEGRGAGALDMLADAAIAGGLMGVGAGLDLTTLRRNLGPLALACAMKLIVLPAALYAWATILGLDPLARAVLVAAGATPGAAASYTLARQLGGDAELVAGCVTATVLLSAIALPLWIAATAPTL
jgi:predicted permease